MGLNTILDENFGGDTGAAMANILMGNPLPQIGRLFQGPPDAQPNMVARDTAKLLREQFADWQNTFMPIELEALKGISFNNDTLLPNALDKARKTVSDSYGSMGGILERQNRGLGIVPTSQQEATNKRLLNLNEAATTASVQNKTRANVRQMDEQILMGTTPNPNIVR
jgi:hypothetical protein